MMLIEYETLPTKHSGYFDIPKVNLHARLTTNQCEAREHKFI